VPIFESHLAFEVFRDEVLRRARSAHSRRAEEFVSRFRKSAAGRVKTLKCGEILWRARIGSGGRREPYSGDAVIRSADGETLQVDLEWVAPFPREEMKPDRQFVQDGRLNPRGIAYLYLAGDKDTAIAEVRPWVGELVSIGQFEVLENIQVVDCVSTKYLPYAGDYSGSDYKPPAEDERDDVVWGAIGHAFAVPATQNEAYLTYAPTQILAEVLRDEGYDGIAYRSAMSWSGYNVALFDSRRARHSLVLFTR
jgi:RES domain